MVFNRGDENKEKPYKKEGVQEQQLDKELMLFDSDTGNVHILNETAKAIWHLADGTHTLKQIEEGIQERFFTSNSHGVRGDIERIIRELKEKGLIIF